LGNSDSDWRAVLRLPVGSRAFACAGGQSPRTADSQNYAVPAWRLTQIEKEATDPNTEFWMAIVGPITSAVLGFLLLGLAHLSGWTGAAAPETQGAALLLWLEYINLALAAFNMIPGFPLDGGRVLRAILWWSMHDVERATRATAHSDRISAIQSKRRICA
jgi:Zn-dependent protease